jgi:hypothetical protein
VRTIIKNTLLIGIVKKGGKGVRKTGKNDKNQFLPKTQTSK